MHRTYCFYHFYKGLGVISFYLSPCAVECQHGFSQTKKVKLCQFVPQPHLSNIMTSLKLYYISPTLSLQEEVLKMIRTTFILGIHGIRC